jgi:hypothetical protein
MRRVGRREGALIPSARVPACRARSSRILAAALALAFVQAGCAIGYAGVRPVSAPGERPPEIPATARFTIVGGGDAASALERALRGHAGVPDVRRAKAAGVPDGTFVVRVDRTEDAPAWSMASSLVSFFTFAAVPGVYVGDVRLAFGITAPGGATQRLEYRYRAWWVSWAPLLLFCPNFAGTMSGGAEPQEPTQHALDEIAAHVLVDAAPFVAAHAAEGAP